MVTLQVLSSEGKQTMEGNGEVVRHLARIINSDKFGELNEVLAPTYIRHDPNPLMKDVGREEYVQAFRRLRNAFPDAHWTLEEILSDNDRVVGRWSFRGTHHGQFFNIPPSVKQ
jgi:SnoaL-like polyketide cyclase